MVDAMTNPDTPYYLLDATVREARGAPTGRMSTFDGALDTAMWVFDTLRLDALCAAVAQVAEAMKEREWQSRADTWLEREKEYAAERDALRVEVAALRKDAERLDWLERVATTRKAYPLTIAPAYNATGHVGAAVFTIGDTGLGISETAATLRAAIDAAKAGTE